MEPTRSIDPESGQPAYPIGQRLVCARCHAEIEITRPCPCTPPDQVFECCGEAMRPVSGTAIGEEIAET
jgi:hypothetical protein